MKVLVADDEKDITDVMARRLTKEGFEVSKAYNGNEAWEQILNGEPDVVLLDVNMPYKDGFTILKDLRLKPPAGKRLAVVVISGRSDLEDIREGFELEADHYITKPFEMSDILKAIRITTRLTGHYQ